MYFETYVDKANEHRWRLKTDNGEIVADSGEGYKDESSMKKTIAVIRRGVTHAKIRKADDA